MSGAAGRSLPCWPRYVLVAAVGLVSVAWFFRFHIASGFTRWSGDSYDGMIEVAILQHWQNVLTGHEAWNSLAYFQPAANTLGYNDGYLAYGLIYSLARGLGLAPIAAAESVNVAMKAIGFFAAHAFLRRRAVSRAGWALAGAVIFTIADVTLIHVNHAQLLTIAFVPLAASALWNAVEALHAGETKRLLISGGAYSGLFALWISTAFYPAWFFGLFVLLVLIVHLLSGRGQWRAFGAAAWRARTPLALIAVGTLVLLAPFLSVYLGKAAETGARRYLDARDTTIRPLGLFDPGTDNGVWSWLYAIVAPAPRPQDAVFGIAPALFVVSLIAAIGGLRRRAAMPSAWRSIGLALIVSWLLIIRFGQFSPWIIVHTLVPGASALRVVGRFQLVLLGPSVALAARLLDRLERPRAIVLAGVLLVEQAAGTAAPVRLDQAAQLAIIDTMPPPPAACRYFVVRSARPYPYPVQDPANDRLYAHNVDAMVLAEFHRLPMLNGFSSFNPPGWDFADPDRADFTMRAARYARRFGLRDVCLLDRRHVDAWQPLPTD